MSTSLPAGFFIFEVFEFFTLKHYNNSNNSNNITHDNYHLYDSSLILIFSIPYLYDFVAGICSVILISKLSEFNETCKRLNNNNNNMYEIQEEGYKLLNEITTDNNSNDRIRNSNITNEK